MTVLLTVYGLTSFISLQVSFGALYTLQAMCMLNAQVKILAFA